MSPFILASYPTEITLCPMGRVLYSLSPDNIFHRSADVRVVIKVCSD